jgi:hypothetical protein
MSSLARPWRRWAIAAPAGSFVIAVFVLAPGGIPAIGMPAALEVGAGGQATQSTAGSHVMSSVATGPRSTSHPTKASSSQNPGTSTRTVTGAGSRPTVVPSSDGGVTVVSAQQPVVVSGGGESGDDGNEPGPSRSPNPSASPTGSGGGGPGDQ